MSEVPQLGLGGAGGWGVDERKLFGDNAGGGCNVGVSS
jgi:hypothetical protein